MWCEHPTGQLAEDKQPTCRHANVSTLLGEDMLDVGQAPGFEPCSCSVLNWELETSDQRNQSEHGLGSLLLFWRKYPMIWRGFKGASGGFSLILTVADAKRCSHRITSDLEKTHFTNFYFFFQEVLVCGTSNVRWAPLLSFPSIQSYAKGLLQYYDSIITISGEYADFSKHTSLSSRRENTCWALEWKHEHTVNVLSQTHQ